jgi:hypothetical protein
MVQRYSIRPYYHQRLDLIKLELAETFRREPEAKSQQRLLISEYA